MTNTLAAPTDLADFPGAPFSDALVDSAVSAVRGEAGWHIAPAVTETVTVVSEGGTVLLVPSLRVTAVTEVRDVSGDTPEALTGWVLRRSGILERGYGWPKRHAIEVDLTHGYAETPPELLPVLARRANDARASSAGQVRLGSLSVGTTSVGTAVTAADEAVVRRYSL
jgi:hypothetical protein